MTPTWTTETAAATDDPAADTLSRQTAELCAAIAEIFDNGAQRRELQALTTGRAVPPLC